MTHVDIDPPSQKQLLKTTAIAAGIAIVVLFVAVLPAEYDIDPLRTGHLLGLTDEPETPIHSHQTLDDDLGTYNITIELEPGSGWKEHGLKVYLDEGEVFEYEWSSSTPIVYDLHNDRQGSYHDGSGVGTSGHGYLTAPIDGCHGWAVKNDNDVATTFTLTLVGEFDPETDIYRGPTETPDLCS